MIELHPFATVEIVGQETVEVTGGDVTLDALAIPYVSATLTVPWTPDLDLDDFDPRDDVRIIISAGNTGHWEYVAGDGFGHGPFGHGPFGH